MSKLLTNLLLSCLFYGFVSLTVFSQTTNATLSGAVEDAKGAAVPGVKITVTNPATGLERTVMTDQSGAYIVPLLPPATYTVMAEQTGFKRVQFPDIVLNVNDRRSLRIQLEVGDVSGVVEVRADDAPMVDTSPAVGTTIDRTFVGNLPLNGRSFQSLILLTPGIIGTVSDGTHPGEFSVNGQRQNANYFTVDGVSANTGVSSSPDSREFSQRAGGALPGTTALGTTSSLVSIDALEEFKIQTSTYSAEFGRQPGAQVQIVTRAGGNQFHGTAFEYFRNDALDANNWFVNARRLPKTPLRQNQFGATFSGPVILPRFGEGGKPYWSGRNRTFFFFSYEGLRLLLPVVTVAPTVPSLRLRELAAPAVRPFLDAYPIPTGPEILDSSGSPTGEAPLATSFSNPSSVDTYSIRVDHTVNSKLALFGRYGDTPSNSFRRFLNQLTGNVMRARTLTLGATLAVTTRINNEVRFNYSSSRGRNNFAMDNFGGALPLTVSQLTSGYSGPGVKAGTVAFDRVGKFSGFINLGDDADNYSRQFNIVDNASWIKGAHQFKFGIDWRRLNSTYGPFTFFQFLNFRGEVGVRDSIADSVQIAASKEVRPIYDNYSLYLQDTWKPSSRLTFDLGVRWEINPAPYDANGSRPVVLTGIQGSDVSGVTIAPPSEPFYKTFWTAFAPRVGAAYQVRQTSGRELVLRGGFGVYHDLGSGWASGIFGGYPFRRTISLGNVPFPLSPAPQPPPFDPVPTQITPQLAGQDFNALDPDLRLPYTLQWNLALEQSFGREQTVSVSYVASSARQLTTRLFLNDRANPFDPLSRPNPNLGDISYVTNGPTSDYHSMQAQYQRRLSHGLQALVNYTWSHAIDEISNEFDFGQLERGNASFDVRQNLSAAVTYDLPRFRGTNALGGAVKAIVNGWSLDAILYARTGTPLDLSAGANIVRSDGNLISVRPDVVPGVPFWIKDPNVAGGQRLNQAAFASPPLDPRYPPELEIPARQGTLGRNVVRLPGIHQINMAIRRQFSFSERIKLQLKAEAFNVLNHPLFGSYGNGTFSPSRFGVPRSMLSTSLGGLNALYQIGGPRSIQLSLRLSF